MRLGSIVTFYFILKSRCVRKYACFRMEHEQLRALLKQGSWLGPARLRARGTLKWGIRGPDLALPLAPKSRLQGLHRPGWVWVKSRSGMLEEEVGREKRIIGGAWQHSRYPF